jgi:hypothetical protein
LNENRRKRLKKVHQFFLSLIILLPLFRIRLYWAFRTSNAFAIKVASLLSDKQTTNKHSSPPLSTQKEAISKQNLPTKQSKAKRSEAAAASSKSKHHLAQLLRVQSPKPPLLDRPFRTAQHSAGSQQLPFAAGAGLTY